MRIALEPTARHRDLVECGLAVVPERRVAQVMSQTGRLDQVGVTSQRLPQLTTDLGTLQRVRQPSARKVALPGNDDLRLGREPAQSRTVQNAGAVALEGDRLELFAGSTTIRATSSSSYARRGTLLRAPIDGGQRLSLPSTDNAARPASSRAIGTRKGEHET